MKFRFHYIGMYHLPTAKRFYSCAYTQKIIKLSQMLISLGHEVYFYGPEGSDEQYFTKAFTTHSLKDIKDSYGDGDNRFELGYDWSSQANTFRYDKDGTKSIAHTKFIDNCIKLINANKKDDDFLLSPQGKVFKPIWDAVGLLATCEPGIGYGNSGARFRAFESSFIQNHTYGAESDKGNIGDGKFFDRVIPNYFENREFPFEANIVREDYYLFVGRVIAHKGVHIAQRLAQKMGKTLIIAGQTDADLSNEYGVKYVGVVDPVRKYQLMAHAQAVLVPTVYLEPFGGVNIEAQLCGTPVITTNFGAFPETVVHGVTGFRCDTFKDFENAAMGLKYLDRMKIRKHAERYLTDFVKWDFEYWFQDIYNLIQQMKQGNKEPWYSV